MSQVPPSSTPRLSIAVLGVGGIGSTFAYHLARAGHHVTVIARPMSARLQQLRNAQAIALQTGETAEIRVADHLEEEIAYDLVIVTTLAHQVDALLPSLRHSKARWIQFMFNTFDPDRLRAAVGEDRCSFGMPFVMASLDREGKLKQTVSSSRKTLHGDRRWTAVFNDAAIPSTYEANMPLWLRCHVPLCIAMESVAVQAQQRGAGVSWTEALMVARGLHGGFHIVEGLGYALYPSAKRRLNRLPDPLLACFLWSVSRNKTFRELLATGGNECRALVDVLAAAASATQSIPPQTIRSVLDIKPPAPPSA